MKTSHIRVSAVAAMAVAGMLTAASLARADDTIVANVPFSFMVGDTQLPAGSYVLESQRSDPNVVKIASATGRQLKYIITTPAADRPTFDVKPQIEFQKIGNQYVLAAIDASDGRQFAVTSMSSRNGTSSRAGGTR